MTDVSLLLEAGACQDPIEFARTHPDLDAAWASCDRGDWLAWYVASRGSEADRKLLARAISSVLVLSLGKKFPGDVALENAEAGVLVGKWARGEVTGDEVLDLKRDWSSDAARALCALAWADRHLGDVGANAAMAAANFAADSRYKEVQAAGGNAQEAAAVGKTVVLEQIAVAIRDSWPGFPLLSGGG